MRENRVTIERENGEQSDLRSAPTGGRGGVSRNRARILRRRPRAVHSPIKGPARCQSRAGHHRESQRCRQSRKSAWIQAARLRFNIREHPHLDHGYAVTSHSSQGQTADRVLIHVDTDKSELLVNDRFAYVSVSRAQYDARIYTNDRSKLPYSLSRDNSQRTATEAQEHQSVGPKIEPASARSERPEEREQGHSLGMGLA